MVPETATVCAGSEGTPPLPFPLESYLFSVSPEFSPSLHALLCLGSTFLAFYL